MGDTTTTISSTPQYQGTALFGRWLDQDKIYLKDYVIFDFVWKWFLLGSGLWFACSSWWTLDYYFDKTMAKHRKAALAFQIYLLSGPLYAASEHLSDVVLLFAPNNSFFQHLRVLTQGVSGGALMECWNPFTSLDCNGSPPMFWWSWSFMIVCAVGLLTHIGTMWYIVHTTAKSEQEKHVENLLVALVGSGLLWNTFVTDGDLLEWYLSHGSVHVLHHCVSVTWFHYYIFNHCFEDSSLEKDDNKKAL